MGKEQITAFAETTYRNQAKRFGIKIDDRRRHMYLIGKTGMGKSTILENMIIEDIRAGKGVAVVDPHGDLAEKVIQFIPPERINDVVYFNPSDMEYPFAFNVVEQVEPHLRHLVASGLLGVFQKLWADSWGPRLEYILRNAVLAVLDYPGSTLLAVTRMLSDKAFRKKVIEKIQDPVVKAFWVNEFSSYADKFASEAVSPIQNKVGQFLSSSLIRNIVGQVNSTIDVRRIMDEGKILILNLSKGRIGEDNSALLGAMMITKIQLAAMSRVDIPENERRDFYLYVDEFQNFATESFANILSEARKYRLNLIMAHQYIEQLDEKVSAAVFGNVGTLIVFRVGAADAEVLVPEFTPIFDEIDIVNLPKYEFYLKLMIDGIASDPFSARGLRPLSEAEKTGNTEKVINVSRERYARKREIVEEKIARWHEGDEEKKVEVTKKPQAPFQAQRPALASALKPSFNPSPPVQSQRPTPTPRPSFIPSPAQTQRPVSMPIPTPIPRPNLPPKVLFNNNGSKPAFPERSEKRDESIYKYNAVCARCGKETRISFMPDGIRPVLCKDCLNISRQEKKNEIDKRRKTKEEELEKVKEISLSDAVNRGAVNFSKETRPTPKEGSLNENEDINFN